MTQNNDAMDEKNREVLERNIEGSRRLIEAKHQKSAAAGGPEPAPAAESGSQNVPIDQADVPAGGTSGGEENLGGGYKSESRH